MRPKPLRVDLGEGASVSALLHAPRRASASGVALVLAMKEAG